ncbi:helix-turn-helix domain-containing protein [Paratissierella segnis]|uniref:Helix-turn-helix domain-containing protein n=1 Tax=Paratissierella segnis TaxID=2763679 RepID=A0A926EUV2_9FIRM|nr:helix-turn-helix domain-containing protein [Paratissierella segnis]MBC8586660.1 helix-turn-helix domain-containing protein [Paratissierella segnis]
MAVFRVEKTRDYTVMSNHHLRNTELSLKAKGLLSLMLSLPENWDYTTKGLSRICKDGIDSINSGVKELEANGYVIRRRLRNEKGQLTTTEYTIFEQPQPLDTNDIPPKGENPILDNPTQEKPILENPILDKPILEKPHQLSTNILNTDLLSMEVSNPYPSNQYPANKEPQEKKMGYDSIGLKSVKEVRGLVLKNIEYEYIKTHHDRGRLEEIVELMVETLCSTKDTINISGDDYPAQLVKEKLLRINSLHIDYVFECLKKTTTYIRNIKRYLLTTLFNAPSTIDNYYSALVNHDFKGKY